MSAKRTPTEEQAAIIAAFNRGVNIVAEAGAGTGKTTLLTMLADEQPSKRILYVAYNKALQVEATAKFAKHVTCKTAHSLAFGAVGRQYVSRLNGPRVPAWKVAKALNIRGSQVGDVDLDPSLIARLALNTVRSFCHSASPEITRWHVPQQQGLEEFHTDLQDVVLPVAQAVWNDITSPSGHVVKFEHDHYLKIWQLSGPRLPYDIILFDEAQDANPVIADIIESQSDHSQIVMVGDRNQAIYGWNGAIDAMSKFGGERYLLSQSFRFGQAVADTANLFLARLGSDMVLKGFDRINSVVEEITDTPDAVLCRTNAGALQAAMGYLADDQKVAIVGGGDSLRNLAEAAVSLLAGAGTKHPELYAFKSWDEVRKYVTEDEAGSDLRVFVKLIDQLGPEAIIDAVNRLVDEKNADVVISTAHKSKGREWPRVVVGGDFPQPSEEKAPSDAELMLAYVTVTRAQQVLDLGGLAWVTEV
ncbi:MAG: ATP-dependent helicase [Nitrososphaerota archaeon]|nr:ATP-dependent helicase [Nitrososphaerota archaeon]